jgi:tetratricopeptide (TPR) repeat protein
MDIREVCHQVSRTIAAVKDGATAHSTIGDSAAERLRSQLQTQIGEIQRRGEKDPIAQLALAVVHDRLEDPNAANEVLKGLKIESISDQYQLQTCVRLAHKINRHDLVQLWISSCADIMKKADDVRQIEMKLLQAYSYEGLKNFPEAIDIFQNLNKDVAAANLGRLPEILHGLGHCYTEYGRLEGNFLWIKGGRNYMQRACEHDSKFASCLGTIHSEVNDYDSAIRILQAALRCADDPQAGDKFDFRGIDVRKKSHLRAEIIFYLADALSWTGLEDQAKSYVTQFREYANNAGNIDAKCHCTYYEIISELRDRRIHDFSVDELQSLRGKLEQGPTRYMPTSFLSAWEALQKYLLFFEETKKILDKQEVRADLKTQLTRVVELARNARIAGDLKPNVFCVGCNCPQDLASGAEFGDSGVIVIGADPNLRPLELHTLVGTLDKVCIAISPEQAATARPDLTFLGGATVHAPDQETAWLLAELLAIHEEIRKQLVEPVFLFGMVPTTAAPAFELRSQLISFPFADEF